MKCLVLLWLVASNISLIFSLSCYTCNNVDQEQCYSGKNLPLENCTSHSYEKLVNIKPVCTKIMKIKTNNSTFYHRSCEKSGPLNNYCTKQRREFKRNVKCQLCHDELCNTGIGDDLSKAGFLLSSKLILAIASFNILNNLFAMLN